MNRWTVGEVIEMKRARQKSAVNRMLGLPARVNFPLSLQACFKILCSVGGEDWPCSGSETYEYRPVIEGRVEA